MGRRLINKGIQKVKSFYDRGIYKIEQIDTLLEAGKITQDEYDYIVGANA